MFTGIIAAVGEVAELQQRGGDVRLRVFTGKLDLSDVALGDSIAVNGVCLTAVALPGDGFAADVSRETLSLTSLAQLKSGSRVNLEKALTLGTRLGGHLVSGHVDGMGTILERHDDARSVRFTVEAPRELGRLIAQLAEHHDVFADDRDNAVNQQRLIVSASRYAAAEHRQQQAHKGKSSFHRHSFSSRKCRVPGHRRYCRPGAPGR